MKPQRRPGFPPEIPDCPPGWRIGPPDFVGIGVARAGSTWWYEPPDGASGVVDVPTARKELHFFDELWDGARPAGRGAIPPVLPAAGGSLAGEWTPRYM